MIAMGDPHRAQPGIEAPPIERPVGGQPHHLGERRMTRRSAGSSANITVRAGAGGTAGSGAAGSGAEGSIQDGGTMLAGSTPPFFRHDDRRERIVPADQRVDMAQRLRINQIRFGDDQPVGQRHLLAGLRMRGQLAFGEQRVDRAQRARQPQDPRHDRISQDRLQDRRRIGKAGGFDQQPRERLQGARLAPGEKCASQHLPDRPTRCSTGSHWPVTRCGRRHRRSGGCRAARHRTR